MDEILKNAIQKIFGNINIDISKITQKVTASPAEAFGKDFWNSLLKIGTTVIMPFAITILCFAMACELYHVYCKANGELDLQLVSSTFMRFILPFVLITKTYDLLQLMFNGFNKLIAQINNSIVTGTAGALTDPSVLSNKLDSMDFFGKLGLWTELFPLQVGMKLMSLVITVIVYGRLFEIVLYWIFAPIPLASFTHSELSQIGKNFIKMFAAVLLQGGFMLLCVALYALLLRQHVFESTVDGGWHLLGYSAVLVFTLTKTGTLSKRVLGTF
mgnify:CR=1 FL=1|jgi:hypothetical protein